MKNKNNSKDVIPSEILKEIESSEFLAQPAEKTDLLNAFFPEMKDDDADSDSDSNLSESADSEENEDVLNSEVESHIKNPFARFFYNLTSMPSEIRKKANMCMLGGIALLICAIVFAIINLSVEILIFSIVGLYAFGLGFSLVQDFRKGKIIEKCMRCTGIEYSDMGQAAAAFLKSQLSGTQTIAFVDAKGNAHKFSVASRYCFRTNTNYILYIKGTQLLSWTSI